MSDAKKPKKSKKHISVAQASDATTPEPASQPPIVTSRPLLRDPMAVTPKADDDEDEDGAKTTAPITLSAADKPKLEPLDTSISVAEADNGTAASEPAEASVAAAQPADGGAASQAAGTKPDDAVNDAPDTLPAEQEFSSPEENDASGEPRDPAADTPPKDAMKKQAEVEEAAKTRHDAEVQELVDSRRYVLPIDTAEKRESKRFALLGAVLAAILIVVWLDIALDAGIIKLGGLKSLTHFFSN